MNDEERKRNEQIAHDWIRSNPHQAAALALREHADIYHGFYGCTCALDMINRNEKGAALWRSAWVYAESYQRHFGPFERRKI
jgi:hypothetical protein